MKLELYFYSQCPFCMMVLRKIESLGLGEKIEFKNTLEVPQNREDHKEKTGRTTVPCLYIDGEPMFESADIIDWLEKNQSTIKG
ncbi:MAG: glutaredoxin [Halobacteriovoraceae bacterium]|nr:glutaredoxin [Halobacteriovoraceae bacterium]